MRRAMWNTEFLGLVSRYQIISVLVTSAMRGPDLRLSLPVLNQVPVPKPYRRLEGPVSLFYSVRSSLRGQGRDFYTVGVGLSVLVTSVMHSPDLRLSRPGLSL